MSEIKSFKRSDRGMAIAIVLVLCTALMGLVLVLVFNTRRLSDSREFFNDDARAYMAARSAVQLAIYKYRTLPREFYKIDELEKRRRIYLSDGYEMSDDDLDRLEQYKAIWLHDMDSRNADTPAHVIAESLDKFVADGHHTFVVEEVELLSHGGYTNDFIKIRAWGEFNGHRQDLEEMIEISVSSS